MWVLSRELASCQSSGAENFELLLDFGEIYEFVVKRLPAFRVGNVLSLLPPELSFMFNYFIPVSEYGRQTQQCFTKPDYRMSLLVDYMFHRETSLHGMSYIR